MDNIETFSLVCKKKKTFYIPLFCFDFKKEDITECIDSIQSVSVDYEY